MSGGGKLKGRLATLGWDPAGHCTVPDMYDRWAKAESERIFGRRGWR